MGDIGQSKVGYSSKERLAWSGRGAEVSTPKAASRIGLPSIGESATGTDPYSSCHNTAI